MSVYPKYTYIIVLSTYLFICYSFFLTLLYESFKYVVKGALNQLK